MDSLVSSDCQDTSPGLELPSGIEYFRVVVILPFLAVTEVCACSCSPSEGTIDKGEVPPCRTPVFVLGFATREAASIVGQAPDTQHFRNVTPHTVVTDSEIVSIQVDEALLFPNVRFLEPRINARVPCRVNYLTRKHQLRKGLP